MSYILKQYDTDLLRFDMQKDIDGVSAQILSVNEKNRSLLPLDLELSDYGLAKWLKRRTIPSNRAYVQNFLAKLGLNEKDTKGIIDFCTMDDDLQDWETYAKTRVPATYSDFIELAQQLMGHSQKEKLRRIINFKFKRHSRYNWSNERLGVVEKLLQKRVQFVLHIV